MVHFSGFCLLMVRSQQAWAVGISALFASSCNFIRFASSGYHDAAASSVDIAGIRTFHTIVCFEDPFEHNFDSKEEYN